MTDDAPHASGATANPSVTLSDQSLRKSRLVLTMVAFVVALAADLLSKAWAWNNLRPPAKPIVVIDPLFELSFSFNTGAAFGFLNGMSWARAFFIVVTLIALAYMAWLAWSMPTVRAYGFIGVALVASGAAGNLHDRLVRQQAQHYGVVDFLKINYPWGGSWPTFNIADVALLVGVGLLFIYMRNYAEPEAASASDQRQAGSDDAPEESAAEASGETAGDDDEPAPAGA